MFQQSSSLPGAPSAWKPAPPPSLAETVDLSEVPALPRPAPASHQLQMCQHCCSGLCLTCLQQLLQQTQRLQLTWLAMPAAAAGSSALFSSDCGHLPSCECPPLGSSSSNSRQPWRNCHATATPLGSSSSRQPWSTCHAATTCNAVSALP